MTLWACSSHTWKGVVGWRYVKKSTVGTEVSLGERLPPAPADVHLGENGDGAGGEPMADANTEGVSHARSGDAVAVRERGQGSVEDRHRREARENEVSWLGEAVGGAGWAFGGGGLVEEDTVVGHFGQPLSKDEDAHMAGASHGTNHFGLPQSKRELPESQQSL